MTAFYNSAAWKRCARSYAESKCWVCERCENKNVNKELPMIRQLQVHHKIPLTAQNLDNADIALNHANLELLCVTCHNRERAADKPTCQKGLKLINGRLERIEDANH